MKRATFGGVGTPVEVRAKTRLEYLRGEIEAERISYGEIAELQSLAEYIEPGDVVLLEWAGATYCYLCGSIEEAGGWCTNKTCAEYQ